MNKYIKLYCEAKGIDPSEILNGKRDSASVTRRNALIYLSWLERRPSEPFSRDKSRIMGEIGKEFDMRRHSISEKIKQFEMDLKLYKGHRGLLDDIKKEIAPML